MSDGERRTRCWSIPHYRKLLVHSKSQCNSKSPTVIKRVYYLIEISTRNAILTIFKSRISSMAYLPVRLSFLSEIGSAVDDGNK